VKVVTDGYFRNQNQFFGTDPEVALRRARALSWSLTYFLAQRKLDGLQRYYKELSKMPRDIELGEEALLGCFARAFDCVDADKKVNQKKLETLAGEWFGYMESVKLERQEIVEEMRKNLDGLNKKPGKDNGTPPKPSGPPISPPGGVIPRPPGGN